MDIPMIDSYLESVAGYVHDEDKLVTYKWLSKELEVHVNVAKIILWRYWQKNKNKEIVATFMLIGKLKEGGMRVEVVKDSDMSKAKDKFEQILSEHVYSLQKTLPDIELLAGSGKGDCRFSAITCEKSVKLSKEELLKMRWGKMHVPQDISTEKKTEDVSSKKENLPVKEQQKPSDNKNLVESKPAEKPSKKISPPTKQKNHEKKSGVPKKPIQSQKTGFGHLFGKVGNQQKGKPSTSSTKESSDSASIDSSSSPENTTSKTETDHINKKPEIKDINQSWKEASKDIRGPSPEKKISGKANSVFMKPEKDEKMKKPNASKNKKKARGTKRGRSNDSDDETKKRKRIVVASDSSDESAAASDQEEPDMFDSPSPPPPPVATRSPSPPPVQQVGNKRKVRKLVDKTFMDEDGYLTTKKVHVYESCSDEEPEVEKPKKQPEPKSKSKEPKLPVRKKQTTLMSFFKKG